MVKPLFRRLKHIIEAAVIYSLYSIFYVLPIDYASSLGGMIARKIGPKLKVSRTARTNLKLCFPEFSENKIKRIVIEMWDNLGRILGEFAHWHRIDDKEYNRRVKLKTSIKKLPKRSMVLSGHFGNFELGVRFCSKLADRVNLVYRPANNPFINHLINSNREKNKVFLLTKGKSGLKQLLTALSNGDIIGMMIDQKMNDGVEVPFFNLPVKATNLPAKLAIKYNIPIYMGKVQRTKGAYYEVELMKINLNKDDNITSLTARINRVLEEWIKNTPQQWFWIHRRFTTKF